MTTSRQLKASENIKKILSNIFVSGVFISPELFELSFSITDVKVSPDLQNATVQVFPLAQQSITPEELINRLNMSSNKIRYLLGQKLYAKKVPNLLFKYEKHFDNQDKVSKILELIESVSTKKS